MTDKEIKQYLEEGTSNLANAKIAMFHAHRGMHAKISNAETRAQLFEARLQTLTMHLQRIRDFTCNSEEVAAARMRHIARLALEII